MTDKNNKDNDNNKDDMYQLDLDPTDFAIILDENGYLKFIVAPDISEEEWSDDIKSVIELIKGMLDPFISGPTPGTTIH